MKKFMTKALSVMLVLVMFMLPVSVFAEEGVTYEIKGALELGTKTYEASSLEYTVYTLEPSEIGKYTVSSANSLVAIVSYNGMWVTVEPTSSTVTETSVEWDCKAVGQSIFVAALSKSGGVNITVAKDGIVIDHYQTVYYENKTKPTAFTFDGNKDDLIPVDVEDGVKSTAVLGADGFYHLDNANGPKLYACLNDPMMPLYNLREPGQIMAIVLKPDNTADYKVDYNGAFDEYWACVDAATGFYPLTDDLIIMFKNVGDNHKWYGEGGWLDIDAEDGWMYSCYYYEGETFENNEIKGEGGNTSSDNMDGIISEGGDGGIKPGEGVTSGIGADGNFTGGTAGTTNNNTKVPTGSNNAGTGTAHQTGDVSVAIVCVLAAAVAVAVVAFVIIRKKKNTVEF